jgi:isocitrate lyase
VPKQILWVSPIHYVSKCSLTAHKGTNLISISRTDAEAATLITSTIDPRDHAYILGATNPSLESLNNLMIAAAETGRTGDQLQAIEDAWMGQAGLKLFNDTVVDTINAGSYPNKKELVMQYLYAAKGKSNSEARALAKGFTGVDVYWDWDIPRTREGYYRLQGGCECAINRAIAYAPFADALWMESKLPDYAQAEQFAKGVHSVVPHQKSVVQSLLR